MPALFCFARRRAQPPHKQKPSHIDRLSLLRAICLISTPPGHLARALAGANTQGMEDIRLQRCGFARLLGDGLDYYVKKYEVSSL